MAVGCWRRRRRFFCGPCLATLLRHYVFGWARMISIFVIEHVLSRYPAGKWLETLLLLLLLLSMLFVGFKLAG